MTYDEITTKLPVITGLWVVRARTRCIPTALLDPGYGSERYFQLNLFFVYPSSFISSLQLQSSYRQDTNGRGEKSVQT